MPPLDIRRYLKHGILTQLRAFEAAARLGTLTRAAAELHMAQATASVQIKKLTETVGLALFEQVGNRLRLTEAGQAVYASCGQLFGALSAMERALGTMRGLASGRLQIAAPSAARHFAARLLEAFARLNPGVQATLEIHERLALIERLGRGDDDLYLFVEPPGEREVVSQALVPNPLVVLAAADHPLAAEIDIAFARLAQEPLVMREPGSGIRMIVLRLFARHGIAPRIHMELGSDEAVREAVLAGLGVAVLPRYTLGLDPVLARLVCLDVEGFPLESYWHFVYPLGRRLSPAARAFMDFARAEAKSLFRDCLRAPRPSAEIPSA
ncbi:MAG TPA: LysR substrate-binding domain-containing protein [Burkholderiales bacterium]|nr:LysR substrate-binding domain-containing protein [Burkholderiales bacterium]